LLTLQFNYTKSKIAVNKNGGLFDPCSLLHSTISLGSARQGARKASPGRATAKPCASWRSPTLLLKSISPTEACTVTSRACRKPRKRLSNSPTGTARWGQCCPDLGMDLSLCGKGRRVGSRIG